MGCVSSSAGTGARGVRSSVRSGYTESGKHKSEKSHHVSDFAGAGDNADADTTNTIKAVPTAVDTDASVDGAANAADATTAAAKAHAAALLSSGKLNAVDMVKYEDLELHYKCGEGSFGIVYHGMMWGQEVAVKQLKLRSNDAGANSAALLDEFHNECEIMRTLRQRNIASFLGACVDYNHRLIIIEWATGGNLKHYIQKMKDNMTWRRYLDISLDIATGLTWLHHMNIIHRDLKPSNLLIDKHGTVKICDFGLSKIILGDKQVAAGDAGTPTYMSPEVLSSRAVSFGADVWSFAIILIEMLTGTYPYGKVVYDMSSRTHDQCIAHGSARPIMPERASRLPKLQELILRCLRPEVQRPPMIRVLKRLRQMDHHFSAAQRRMQRETDHVLATTTATANATAATATSNDELKYLMALEHDLQLLLINRSEQERTILQLQALIQSSEQLASQPAYQRLLHDSPTLSEGARRLSRSVGVTGITAELTTGRESPASSHSSCGSAVSSNATSSLVQLKTVQLTTEGDDERAADDGVTTTSLLVKQSHGDDESALPYGFSPHHMFRAVAVSGGSPNTHVHGLRATHNHHPLGTSQVPPSTRVSPLPSVQSVTDSMSGSSSPTLHHSPRGFGSKPASPSSLSLKSLMALDKSAPPRTMLDDVTCAPTPPGVTATPSQQHQRVSKVAQRLLASANSATAQQKS